MKLNKIWVPVAALLPWTSWPAENWFFPNSPKAPTNSIQTRKLWVHSRCELLSSQGGWLVSLEDPSPPHFLAALVSLNFGPKYLSQVPTKMTDWWWYTCTTLVYESLIFSPQKWSSFWCVRKRDQRINFLSSNALLTLRSVSSLNNPSK